MNKRGVTAAFVPAWWCRGPHCQTLWPYLFRYAPRPQYRRERVELGDRDFIDIDWHGPRGHDLILVFHGLEGSSQSPYVRGLCRTAATHGVECAVIHFRGCSGEPNRLARSYHAGDTGDLESVLDRLEQRNPRRKISAVGYSLGGNVLLKWLGETGSRRLARAVAVSVPYSLADSARRLEHGASRLYQYQLVRRMRRSVRRKFARIPSPIDLTGLDRARTFWDFDELVTAPLHGFASCADYYERSSCGQFLNGIRTPTLLIHARDDPFMTTHSTPDVSVLPANITLEVSNSGGHTGFVAGRTPWQPQYWLELRIIEYLTA
ncbi:MAG: hydrolase [Gammaproteobacteria bacterium]|nr:hydrolase [Gammaproteobacteria bacterium]MDH3468424.1 hydrolase [Gammaproteobacteria bacterium]